MSVVEFPLAEEYKKNTGIKPEDVESLREWLKKQPHLPGEHITDLDIILAYHSCNRSSESTKRLLDVHFTLKTIFTGLCANRAYDDKIDKALRTILLKPLNTRTKEGYAFMFSCVLDKNAKNFVIADVGRLFLMVLDLWQYTEGTWPGFVLVFDMANIGVAHLSCFDFTALQQVFYFLQEALLLKLKGIHLVNTPPFMDKVMALINSVGNFQDLLTLHGKGYKGIDQYYPLELLPKDVGGSYKSLEECRDMNIEWLKKGSDYFARESLKRVTESRRPGKPTTVSDLFGGIEGSFKKLDID